MEILVFIKSMNTFNKAVLTVLLLIASVPSLYYGCTRERTLKGVVLSHSAIGSENGYVNYYTVVRLNNGGILTLRGAEAFQVSTGDSIHHVTRIPRYKDF